MEKSPRIVPLPAKYGIADQQFCEHIDKRGYLHTIFTSGEDFINQSAIANFWTNNRRINGAKIRIAS